MPEPGKTMAYDDSETIDPEDAPLSGGEFLVKVLVLSIDPFLRGKMRDPKIQSYTVRQSLELYNYGIGVVLHSENPAVKPGHHLYGVFKFQHYAIEWDAAEFRALENAEGLPWSAYIGICAMPGLTAYVGWKEYARPKRGEVAFVTAGAGPVGSTAIQLAKADGLKVIASARSDEKVAFLRDIGADVAFNYKTTSTRTILQKEGPIDIYWDNVGGEVFEAAIDFAARHARFIECGMISQYNATEPYYVKNLRLIVWKELAINGFIVTTLQPKYEAEFLATVPRRVASGEIEYREDRVRGLENAGRAIVDVQSGRNKGKSVVAVADE
ncbi:NAD-P-binding protein [Trametes punicea]|nr:NAD-P-binding protein [Trametes punicea]